MAVVIAPAIGPTLGGWITDNYTWRWIFYINVPVGLLSLYLTNRIVEDPPYMKIEQQKTLKNPIDYMGLGLIGVGIGLASGRASRRGLFWVQVLAEPRA